MLKIYFPLLYNIGKRNKTTHSISLTWCLNFRGLKSIYFSAAWLADLCLEEVRQRWAFGDVFCFSLGEAIFIEKWLLRITRFIPNEQKIFITQDPARHPLHRLIWLICLSVDYRRLFVRAALPEWTFKRLESCGCDKYLAVLSKAWLTSICIDSSDTTWFKAETKWWGLRSHIRSRSVPRSSDKCWTQVIWELKLRRSTSKVSAGDDWASPVAGLACSISEVSSNRDKSPSEGEVCPDTSSSLSIVISPGRFCSPSQISGGGLKKASTQQKVFQPISC